MHAYTCSDIAGRYQRAQKEITYGEHRNLVLVILLVCFLSPFVLQLTLNDPWAEFLCHNTDPQECWSIFQHFFFFFFFFVFYRVASCMHVIDCFHWPGTSLRFTSACNYWPSSLVSQCYWCVYVCVRVCTCICHTLTINRLLHLFQVVPDAAWGENNHRIMGPCYPHTSYITQCGSHSKVSGLSLVVKCEVINLQYGRSRRRGIMWRKQHVMVVNAIIIPSIPMQRKGQTLRFRHNW